MANENLHRNSQRRIYEQDYIYFITTNTRGRFPYFKEEIFFELFIENLKICKELKRFKLYGFVIMPDHIHLLVWPSGEYNISKVIKSLKENFSRNANIMMNITKEGETTSSRLRVMKEIFKKQYGFNQNKMPKFQWQESFHDHVIRGQEDFNTHLKYIWWNPEKHHVINNWQNYQYSSFKNFQDLIDEI